MTREGDGKRVPILVSKEMKSIIDGLMTFRSLHILEKLLVSANRTFSRFTTGAYPFFGPTNFLLDQISSAAQTRTKMVPVYDALKSLSKAVSNKSSQEREFFM